MNIVQTLYYCTVLYKSIVRIYTMKLSKKALSVITPKIRLKLALGLDCTEQWIIQLLDKNVDDGKLTTATALNIIRQETGLSDDVILVNEPEIVK